MCLTFKLLFECRKYKPQYYKFEYGSYLMVKLDLVYKYPLSFYFIKVSICITGIIQGLIQQKGLVFVKFQVSPWVNSRTFIRNKWNKIKVDYILLKLEINSFSVYIFVGACIVIHKLLVCNKFYDHKVLLWLSCVH